MTKPLIALSLLTLLLQGVSANSYMWNDLVPPSSHEGNYLTITEIDRTLQPMKLEAEFPTPNMGYILN